MAASSDLELSASVHTNYMRTTIKRVVSHLIHSQMAYRYDQVASLIFTSQNPTFFRAIYSCGDDAEQDRDGLYMGDDDDQ